MSETRRDCTIWLWSHSVRASAVESGTWQRSPSLSSASIISSKPRKSSTRCSARRPPMKGEVGDWQSKMPLEYSSAFEPGGSNIAQGQARGKQVRPAARLRNARQRLLLVGIYLNQTQRWCWILPTILAPRATWQSGEGQALAGTLGGWKLQQEGGGLIRQRTCMPQPRPQVQGAGWAPAPWDVSEVESTAGGTGSANALSHPVGIAWPKSDTDGFQRKPRSAFFFHTEICYAAPRDWKFF